MGYRRFGFFVATAGPGEGGRTEVTGEVGNGPVVTGDVFDSCGRAGQDEIVRLAVRAIRRDAREVMSAERGAVVTLSLEGAVPTPLTSGHVLAGEAWT